MKLAFACCLSALSLFACGDDEPSGTGGGGGGTPSCIDDPWSCPDGQTCWVSQDQQSFSCLNAGPGAVGAQCQNIAGTPTCAQDLICLQLQASSQGSCTEYCDPADPAHACPGNRQCLLIQLIGSQFHACEPPASGMGGGGAGGGASGG
jgi:hypothetical protein